MNEIDFTILFPSRDHQDLLSNLLASISRNSHDLSRVEVLIAIDDDDPNMQAFASTHQYSFVKFFTVKRSLNFSRDYYNYLYSHSRGKWIIACNDDAEFITPDWDLKAKTTLQQYIGNGPNVVYGWIEDMLSAYRLTQFGNYCCFPLQGRDGIDALGGVFPPRIPTWGADIFIEQLYRGVGRIVELPIVIKHISVHNKLRERDAIHDRIAQNQVPVSMNPEPGEVNRIIAALKRK